MASEQTDQVRLIERPRFNVFHMFLIETTTEINNNILNYAIGAPSKVHLGILEVKVPLRSCVSLGLRDSWDYRLPSVEHLPATKRRLYACDSSRSIKIKRIGRLN